MSEIYDKRLNYLLNNFNYLSSEELDYLKALVDKIIDKDNLSIVERKLIIKLAVREKCDIYKYPYVDVSFEHTNSHIDGCYNPNMNKIIINEDKLLKKTYETSTEYPFFSASTSVIDRMLLVANHECEHYFQNYEQLNNKLSKKSFSDLIFRIFNNYISIDVHGENEYKKNYGYKEIENYANIQGWYDTAQFLVNHKSSRTKDKNYPGYKIWLQASARHEMSYQTNEEGKSKIIEDYNIATLSKIVYNHPSLVEQYPILNNFYYGIETDQKRGTLKEKDVLLSQYLKLEDDYMKTKSRSQIEEEQYVYRQFFYYLLSKDTSNIDKKYESVLYDLIFNDLYSLQGVFDIKNKKVKAYENIVRIKINRINNFINCLEELGSFELLDKVKSIVEETLKVYETSKLMYDNFNDNVEANMKTLRDKFSLTNIEFRNPEGRESAMNI